MNAPAVVSAVRTLAAYTAGRFDLWTLAGPRRASCRAHVMAELRGVARVPQSKAGVTVLREEFYVALGVAGGVCTADRDKDFVAKCKEIIGVNQ